MPAKATCTCGTTPYWNTCSGPAPTDRSASTGPMSIASISSVKSFPAKPTQNIVDARTPESIPKPRAITKSTVQMGLVDGPAADDEAAADRIGAASARGHVVRRKSCQGNRDEDPDEAAEERHLQRQHDRAQAVGSKQVAEVGRVVPRGE